MNRALAVGNARNRSRKSGFMGLVGIARLPADSLESRPKNVAVAYIIKIRLQAFFFGALTASASAREIV
jgi:hypothetical protein